MSILKEHRERWGMYDATRTQEPLELARAVLTSGTSDDIRPCSQPFTGSFYLFEKPLAFGEETFNKL
jgi:hypothetical protein